MAERATLGDFVTLQRGTTYKSRLLGQSGPFLLGLASIRRNGGFRTNALRTYGGESPEKLTLRPGDVYVSLKDVTQSGDLLGAAARVPASISVGRLTQDTVKLLFRASAPSVDYVYWSLRTPRYREYCRSHAIGTTNLSLSREDFLSYPIGEPTPPQAKLVELLQALEEKIDLNLRINDTLVAIRRSQFRNLAAQPSERESPIEDLASVKGGATPSTRVGAYWDGAIAWATPRDLSRLSTPVLLDTERHITDAGAHQISSGVLPPGTVLLSSRAPIGYLAISEVPVSVNQGFIAMVPDKGLSSWFLLSWAESAIDEVKGRANGTTFQEINKANFRPIKVHLPSATVLARFDTFVKPLHLRLVSNERENQTLTRLRDALLPLLSSGELRTAASEDIVGAAV